MNDYRLTARQKNVLRDLTDEPQVFGCAEGVANGLTKPTTKRPALAQKTFVGNWVWRQQAYKLTDAGREAKRLIILADQQVQP